MDNILDLTLMDFIGNTLITGVVILEVKHYMLEVLLPMNNLRTISYFKLKEYLVYQLIPCTKAACFVEIDTPF